MAYFSRRTERERLEREVQGEHYAELLAELRNEGKSTEAFSTWRQVIDFMHSRDESLLKNEILRSIFACHKHDHDPRWRTILLIIFWPAIESIHWKKRGWDTDPEERWQNVVWVFLRVVCRIDPVTRPNRLAQKVVNDTIHFLWDEYQRSRLRLEKEILMDDERLDDLEIKNGGIDFDSIDRSIEKDRLVERLRRHLNSGRITEEDFFLLIGTRVYGTTLSEYADHKGISYQAAKKRRQRVETLLRNFEARLMPEI